MSGDISGRGPSPTPALNEASKQSVYYSQYQSPAPSQIYEPPSFQQYSSGANEQLERLKIVQDEIDKKNNEERNEINKIMKEIMDTSKRFILGSNSPSPRFGVQRYSGQGDILNS